jgi:hypothetical protein
MPVIPSTTQESETYYTGFMPVRNVSMRPVLKNKQCKKGVDSSSIGRTLAYAYVGVEFSILQKEQKDIYSF